MIGFLTKFGDFLKPWVRGNRFFYRSVLLFFLNVFLVACVDREPQSLLTIQLPEDTRLLEILSRNPQLLTALESSDDFSNLSAVDAELLSLLLESSTSQNLLDNEEVLKTLCTFMGLGDAVNPYQTEILGHLTTLIGQDPCVDVEAEVSKTNQILDTLGTAAESIRNNGETRDQRAATLRVLMIQSMQKAGDKIPVAVLDNQDTVPKVGESQAVTSSATDSGSCEHLNLEESDFQSRLDQSTKSTFITGNTVRVLPEAIESYAERMALLDQAQRFIHIYTLDVEANVSGYEVVLELANRVVLDGVQVNIIYHPITQAENGSLMMMMALNAVGAQTVPYAPLNAESATDYFLQGPHKKAWITDHPDYGVQAIVGGRNIGDFYLGDRQSPVEGEFNNYWRDTDMLLRGSLLRPLIEDFITTFNEQAFSKSEGFELSTMDIPDILDVKEVSGSESVAMRLLENEPDRSQDDANILYESLINHAERTIDIATPYFVPSETLIKALHVALARGVKVRLLTNSKNGSDMGAPTYYSSLYYWEELIKAGAEIFMWDLPLIEEDGRQVIRTMHAKTLEVDRCVFVPGSWNFDMRSWAWQNEYLFPIFDSKVAGQEQEQFNQDVVIDGVVPVDQHWLEKNLTEEERRNMEFFHSYVSGFL